MWAFLSCLFVHSKFAVENRCIHQEPRKDNQQKVEQSQRRESLMDSVCITVIIIMVINAAHMIVPSSWMVHSMLHQSIYTFESRQVANTLALRRFSIVALASSVHDT